ncbi:Selenocysteine lyase/Cysteine desulfurase [Streptomyces indicus]|uniref:Selenocysteine lyase/Cysteine desulfurase n=2 Tax=Streptomyces indicus TaxID=417292 RepID=A0A1G9FEL6_9ACTN|nr:Selenocysteine lyase/Cysteine desulfurase [Streptomyces indicus]
MPAQSGTMNPLAPSLFAPATTHLNTASFGLLPQPAVRALQDALAAAAGGRPTDMWGDLEATRAAFARIAGVPMHRVALGSSVTEYAAIIAASLPEGAEVLLPEADFASLVNPFHLRRDLKIRTVPLEALADEVRDGTALVATSAVQSADGRLADLTALTAAARAHGARTLVDASQSAGWLPVAEADYTVAVGYKWLLCPRGITFFIAPEDQELFASLHPLLAGWVAGEHPWDSCYGPVTEYARSARRFDISPSLYAYVAARHGLQVIEDLGVAAVHAHNTALADRYRAGLAERGHTPVDAPGSAIVSVPGLGARQPELSAAGIELSDRAGNLRASFHLYNSAEDVDRLLALLA